MKTEELRVGNLITDEWAPKGYWHVSKFTDKKVWYGTFNCLLTNARPILLTEEWLINFGFEKIESLDAWTKRNHVLKNKDFNFPVFDHSKINMYFYATKFGDNYFFYNGIHIPVNHIPYVHQIQNLYYALTNEELTLKWNK